MSLALIIPNRNIDALKARLESLLPEEEIVVFPAISKPESVEFAIAWNHPPQVWAQFPNLKVVASLGAGVDHLVFDTSLPKSIKVARIVDSDLVNSMRKYVLMAVLNDHKYTFRYLSLQNKKQWSPAKEAERDLQIGVLGLGQLGADVAIHLAQLGFKVFGFSRTKKEILGVRTYCAQDEEMAQFLNQINLLINILPLTPKTQGILNEELFYQLPVGSYLINVGRGGHLVEKDLIKALENGQIRGACLDVFIEEPLPETHPFWDRPEIIITPHVSSVTNQDNAARQIAANYLNMKGEQPLNNEVNRSVGY